MALNTQTLIVSGLQEQPSGSVLVTTRPEVRDSPGVPGTMIPYNTGYSFTAPVNSVNIGDRLTVTADKASA